MQMRILWMKVEHEIISFCKESLLINSLRFSFYSSLVQRVAQIKQHTWKTVMEIENSEGDRTNTRMC